MCGVAHVQWLYDEDVVVEDVILKWAATPGAAKKLKVRLMLNAP